MKVFLCSEPFSIFFSHHIGKNMRETNRAVPAFFKNFYLTRQDQTTRKLVELSLMSLIADRACASMKINDQHNGGCV